VLDASTLLQLGPAKYTITHLHGPPAAAAVQQQQQQQQQQAGVQREQQLIEQAAAAAAAFRRVAAEAAGAAGMAAASGGSESSSSGGSDGSGFGPWRPFMAPLRVNRRVTAQGHFQETRHLEFDLAGSGLSYEPGDLLAILPRTPAADVEVRVCVGAWLRVRGKRREGPLAGGGSCMTLTCTHQRRQCVCVWC
jgi:sulfite reductase alpha subunit-like flavoprotein